MSAEIDPFEIPAFLRLTKEERAGAWASRALMSGQREGRAKKAAWNLPKSIDETGLALFKEQERARAARQKQLASLKERAP
jgi:hypothetical protein